MSTSVTQAFIKQFEREVHEAYQRMGSKLRSTVRSKGNVIGASTIFQKVGKGTASTKARHGAVPVMNLDHTPVECALSDYYAGDWVDQLDELKTNIDERAVIANAGAYALGRKTDDLIIAALNTNTNVALDGSDMMLIGVLVALIAASTGIQLPGVVNRLNGGGNVEASSTTTTTTRTSAPKAALIPPTTPTDDPPTPTPT